MKTFSKLVLLLGISVFFFSHGCAEEMDWEETEHKTDSIELENHQDQETKEIVSLPESKPSCDQKPGFKDKILRIKDISSEKILMLNKLDLSLKIVVALIKDTTIKNELLQEQKNLQTIKKNYSDLKSRLEKNPKNLCGQNPVWKTYNEETKHIVDNIRTQFRLLKRK